jgi:tetratricopeptide (TPR) repeat protein
VGEGADGSLSVEPPALADTIGAATAPNVAAATRLVDAGRTRMAAGDDGAALEQFERAIAIDPGNPYAYYYLAELHFLHRTYDQAIAFADRAASLSDARAPDWASRAYTLQGNAFEAAGRFADARGAYTRAIQAAPGNLAARVGLARVGSPPQP